jgi:tRNA U34 5-carboxymethylaminomethyl modifying GTPase MnmE/TrmE
LTQVEALGDILSAATEQQRKLSLRSTGKRLAVQYEQWRAQLLLARGELEALIDFSEDQHFEESPIDLLSSVTSQILKLKQHLHMHLQNATRGEMLRSGLRVALLGVPNAGKSSLLNGIVGRDAAIVSREAGTTRDIVEIGLDIGGYLCRFGDMAGLRPVTGTCGMLELPSPVEIEGMNRAREWTLESDIVLVVVPVPQDPTNGEQSYFNSEVLEVVSECYRRNICILGVMNKVDLLDGKDPTVTTRARRSLREQFQLFGISTNTTFETSCIQRDHQGVEQLKVGIKNACKGLTTLPTARSRDVPNALQDIIGASERHRSLLNQCLFHIDRFLGESVSVRQFNDRPPEQGDIVLAAEALREAADCLAKILGHGYVNDVDEVLGVVFDKFCVGK